MNKIRVLRLITWLPLGGIERKIAAVVPRLDRELFDPHICCLRERGPLADQLEAQGIPVHVIPFHSRLDPRGLWRLARLIRRLRIDIVHAHMYRANTPATVVSMLGVDVRVIGQYHNVDTWETWRQRRLDAFLAHRRSLNLAVSEAVRLNVISTLGLDPKRVRTLYNGVDTTEFRPADPERRAMLRRALGWPQHASVIVLAARLVPQKNHAFVIEHAPEIVRDFPNAYFVFAGGGPDEQRLKELAVARRVAEHVVFLGPRDDIADVLAASDISILPSSKEGFSNTVLESMACGLPTVASDVGGNREVIDHGIDGLLLEMQDSPQGPRPHASQFVRFVRRLLADEQLRARLRANALKKIECFSLDRMVWATQEIYREVMQGR